MSVLEPLKNSEWTPAAAAHLLSRAGFGGSPKDVESLHGRGLDGAVDSLLSAPDDADIFPPPDASIPQDLLALRKGMEGKSAEEKKAAQMAQRKETQQKMAGLRMWWLDRMRWSPFPAREKAVLFWHGHWATSAEKVRDAFPMWQQNETLRAHALGRFEPLAKEISRDPAMMRYLDLVQSKSGKPNENFARELMELFTLGEGHYSEDDVKGGARAFTGYRINPQTQQFLFAARQHDGESKSFFGFEGDFDGDDIIGFLVADPQCARFLSRKLWVFYGSENPSPELVEALAGTYRRENMDTGRLLGAMFRSREFYRPDVMGRQIKGPVQWLVQACKELDLPIPADASGILRQLGQTPFAPPNVKGWDGGRSWISSATLLLRYNIAGRIVNDRRLDAEAIIPSSASPATACDDLGNRLFQFSMNERLRKSFLTFLEEHPAEKNIRRDVIHLMMSTPDYQLT